METEAAEPITYHISGKYISCSGHGGMGCPATSGERYYGTMTYEPWFEDADPDPDVGLYGTTLSTASLRIDGDSYVRLEDPWYFGSYVYNAPGAGDTDLIMILGGERSSDGLGVYDLQIYLEGTEDMIADDSFPDLIQTGWQQAIMQAQYENGFGGYYRFTLSFDHISPIPFTWDIVPPAGAEQDSCQPTTVPNKLGLLTIPFMVLAILKVRRNGIKCKASHHRTQRLENEKGKNGGASRSCVH
jgi:hypothetical protein